jgi:hypothetical protein
MPSVGGAQQPREPTPSTDEGAGTRTIEFETTEVTQADVTVSPDDRWLVFTILGHLFRMPIAGGVAEQLTFGPYYDSDPVFSPDGQRIAFVSDRARTLGGSARLESRRQVDCVSEPSGRAETLRWDASPLARSGAPN